MLNEEQNFAFERILNGAETSYYLFGVTGSGKTEVYLNLICACLASGRSVLFLVPEISLTPQMEELFKKRFGELVVVHHSRVSLKQRYENWVGILQGRYPVVVGARSAVFAPLKNPGLIIVDEEGEGSYRQDTSPLYDARDICKKIADQNPGCKLVFGSATPSLDAWHEICQKKIVCVELKKRFNQKKLPVVRLANLKSEFRSKNRSIFSAMLLQAIKRELYHQNQVILFVNRRGHSNFVICRNCSFVVECLHCRVSMTYHQDQGLVCHYCGYRSAPPDHCPSCQSEAIRYFGLGTQKVEEALQKEFPWVRYARLDADTTRKKGVMESVLRAMKEKKIDVLIGTQMISKGLDFEDVTLVGVLNPDSMVRMGDYQAMEKAFQQLVQISGRAGRAQKEGEVIVQTYSPELAVFQQAACHNVKSFLDEELLRRKELCFPPWGKIVQILSSAPEEEKARKNLSRFYDEFLIYSEQKQWFELIPPQKSPIEMIDGRYRYRMVIRYFDDQSKELKKRLLEVRKLFRMTPTARLRIDVEPESLL